MNLPAIYHREAEIAQLRERILGRRSFLLHGPRGVGKTLLLNQLHHEIPGTLYCAEPVSGQAVFRTLAHGLLAQGNRVLIQALSAQGADAVTSLSAVSLRGIVAAGLGKGAYWIVLDHIQSPSQSFAAHLKDLCGNTATPLIAVARSEHMEDVGFLLPLFSDPCQRYSLRNFDLATSRQFAVQVADKMQLKAANRDQAIEQIVRYSRGNPGAILAMLQMTVNPKYVARQHIKLSPLYIDFRLSAGG
jgi:hypothetical protein